MVITTCKKASRAILAQKTGRKARDFASSKYYMEADAVSSGRSRRVITAFILWRNRPLSMSRGNYFALLVDSMMIVLFPIVPI